LFQVWLDKEKSILYQLGRDHDLSFKFRVKFYTPDPNLLEDEFTRSVSRPFRVTFSMSLMAIILLVYNGIIKSASLSS